MPEHFDGGVAPDADLSREDMRAAVAAHDADVGEGGTTLAREQGITVRLPVTGQVLSLVVDEQLDALDPGAFARV